MTICHPWFWVAQWKKGKVPSKARLPPHAMGRRIPPPTPEPPCGTDRFTGIPVLGKG